MAQPRLVRDSASRSRMLISKATQPAQPADEHGSEHDAGDETEDPGPRVTLRGRDQNHHASGGALLNLGKRESGTERLEQAVAAFIEALKERTRERMPPSTGPRRRAILAEPKRGKADRRDRMRFLQRRDARRRPSSDASILASELFTINGTYRSSFRLVKRTERGSTKRLPAGCGCSTR